MYICALQLRKLPNQTTNRRPRISSKTQCQSASQELLSRLVLVPRGALEMLLRPARGRVICPLDAGCQIFLINLNIKIKLLFLLVFYTPNRPEICAKMNLF